MKIFYSWQSDTPSKVGKSLIREALDAAVAALKQNADLAEADRPTVDQDTAGVLGSPAIADTILGKIRDANVIVSDVTLTGQTHGGKHVINSNVAIELGYALGVHGHTVLLKVMNIHYGSPDDLPFDLRHRRWPVQFSLAPDASPSERQSVQKSLSRELEKILGVYLEATRTRPAPFAPTPSARNAASYWSDGEPLVTDGGYPGQPQASLAYDPNAPLIFLRIWPTENIEPLTAALLGDFNISAIEPLCGGTRGWSLARNRFGMLTYSHDGESQLNSTTQVFKTGEIWGINAHFLRHDAQEQAKYPDYVPTEAFERGLRASMLKYLDVAKRHFGYPSQVRVAAGLVRINGFKLAMSNTQFWGPIFDDIVVQASIDLTQPETTTEALLKIFNAVYDAAGHERPPNLYGFP